MSNLDLPGERYGEAAPRSAFLDQLQRSLRALPGVTAATMVDHLPRSPLPATTTFTVEGQSADEDRSSATMVTIDPGYLDVFRVPLFQGRPFQYEEMIRPSAMIARSCSARNQSAIACQSTA